MVFFGGKISVPCFLYHTVKTVVYGDDKLVALNPHMDMDVFVAGNGVAGSI